ncbi:anaphase-promoting complex subunit 9-domain-containing protein [Scheffersomyces xylosifermentans]|uniref:anaphase-promoting complex subunit 9-domain-containing protein n=1 Tax=Scheffersomyces xylosifermentans TaxID=1304137 RepID=UPI00315DC5DB
MNSTASNTNNVSSKYNLPKFNTSRAASSHLAPNDTTFNPNDSMAAYNSTTRTVSSSSTSMVSTPSNNIRRFQQQRQQNQQQNQSQGTKKPISQRTSRNGRLIKSKLLNLQQSSKQKVAADGDGNAVDHEIDESHPNKSVPSFIIHKPINMNGYDYAVFTNYPTDIDLQHGDHLPPAVKESQIKAWESAERISRNVIFGVSSESEDEFDDEDESASGSSDSFNDKENSENINNGRTGVNKNNIIQSIPGYTRGELNVIHSSFQDLQHRSVSLNKYNSDEKRMLHDYKKQVQSNQEKIFSSTHSIATRRQMQINQKKDMLSRLFGYSNTLNQEYITNNSSYSSVDNTANIQKTFHEDKEEITSLVEEDRAFVQALEETRHALKDLKNSSVSSNIKRKRRRSSLTPRMDTSDFDYDKFHNVTAKKLDKLYNKHLSEHDRENDEVNYNDMAGTNVVNNCNMEDDNHDDYNEEDDLDELSEEISEELQLFTMSYLRKCIKYEAEGRNGLGPAEGE